jgi:cytochrome c553
MRAKRIGTITGRYLFGAVAASSLAYAAPPYDSSKESYYFGDAILDRLDTNRRMSVNNGFSLFIKSWERSENPNNKASSCVSCHEVPMPGGSGIANNTFVFAVQSDNSRTGFDVLGRKLSDSVKLTPGVIKLKTPPLYGLGILERVACANNAHSLRGGCPTGVFGYRSRITSLEDFVEFAFEKELGISIANTRGPSDLRTITRLEVAMVADYVRHLAPPPKFTEREPEKVRRGEQIFEMIGCSTCHTPKPSVANLDDAWADIEWRAYTDRRQYHIRAAVPYEVRTAPLWGLLYVGPPFLHDGAALSLEQAIHLHEKDARSSAEMYSRLTRQQQSELLTFLGSL